MNEFQIPTLINAGKSSRSLRRNFFLLLLLAMLLHFSFFTAIIFFDRNLFPLFFKKAPDTIQKDSLNYVLVDDKLLDEKVVNEKPKMLGKFSRQSRDVTVNQDLPKLGPNNSDNSSVSSFDRGNPLPGSIPSPELTPSPSPVSEVIPQKTAKPTSTLKPAPKPIVNLPVKEKIVPDLPELDIENDLTSILSIPKKPKKIKLNKEYNKREVPGITSSDEISKINEKPIDKPEAKITTKAKPVVPQKKQPKQQRKITTRKIPVRKISSTNSSTGGKLKKRLNSSAIYTGSKSIAVLKSRYGDYMDQILTRIQHAIIIQQQINPISMHEGQVFMSFTINSEGLLDDIQLIGASPQGITTEISVARSVLKDVHNSGAFKPPTQEMLNDPVFKKIVINFVFENL